MIRKFDTYSEMMPVYCMDCQQFQDMGEEFLA